MKRKTSQIDTSEEKITVKAQYVDVKFLQNIRRHLKGAIKEIDKRLNTVGSQKK